MMQHINLKIFKNCRVFPSVANDSRSQRKFKSSLAGLLDAGNKTGADVQSLANCWQPRGS